MLFVIQCKYNLEYTNYKSKKKNTFPLAKLCIIIKNYNETFQRVGINYIIY